MLLAARGANPHEKSDLLTNPSRPVPPRNVLWPSSTNGSLESAAAHHQAERWRRAQQRGRCEVNRLCEEFILTVRAALQFVQLAGARSCSTIELWLHMPGSPRGAHSASRSFSGAGGSGHTSSKNTRGTRDSGRRSNSAAAAPHHARGARELRTEGRRVTASAPEVSARSATDFRSRIGH